MILYLEAEFLLFGATSVFALRAFSRLGDAHQHYLPITWMLTKSVDCRCSPHLQSISAATPGGVFDEIAENRSLARATQETDITART